MQRHKSAMKAARHAEKRNQINAASSTRVRNTVKQVRKAIDEGNVETAQASLPKMVEVLDRMARRGVVHRNKAARLKSRLVRKVNTAGRKAAE
jgi:small subunit ribosomal protein S20